ncbi:hypothetical protein [Gluconobacter cerinus]|uniref:hypothetical protein n=1 Tax=Gluconobacter cerinus TaxID=38307 RepID=UPI001B8D83D6|nr:hypothetical protein [Gluconobacter cerinus]MBS1020283.1 hypothetical protein [Gluconobacter cerinus]MBS1069574.1 hypothetical protein [Gluconobacter cerinus]
MISLAVPPAVQTSSHETAPLKVLAREADRLLADDRREEGLAMIEALYLQAEAVVQKVSLSRGEH